MYPAINEETLKAAVDTLRPDPTQSVKVRIHFNRFHGGRADKRWHINVQGKSMFVEHWRILPGVPAQDESSMRKEQPSCFLIAYGKVTRNGNTAVIIP